MAVTAPTHTFPRVNQQNAADLNEIQADNIFQMLRAAEEIGKRKQFFEDHRRLLISDGNRLTQEIRRIEQFCEAEWEARSITLLPKIDAIYEKAMALAKSYGSQIKSEESMQGLKLVQTFKSGQLWGIQLSSKVYHDYFEQIAKQIQQAKSNLISEGKDFKIQNSFNVNQQIISSSSDSQLASHANSYFLESRQILGTLEAEHDRLRNEVESLELQKRSLQNVHDNLAGHLKAALPKHFNLVHTQAQNVYNAIHQTFLDYKHKLTKEQAWVNNDFLKGELNQGYKMAREVEYSAYLIINQLEKILKEGA